jgi:hypothetical protein
MHDACREGHAQPMTQAPDCATPTTQAGASQDDYAHFDATLPSQDLQATPTGATGSL